MTDGPARIVAVIPARMGSSRFPGKPLVPILGRPMIEHVYRRAMLAESVDEVVIATCDTEIELVAKAFGARVVMTSSDHTRASDRVAEAAESLDAEIVLMVQGDEPMITPGMMEASLAPFRSSSEVACVNLMKRIQTEQELRDPDTVKVVTGRDGRALYFSREPVPTAGVLGFDRVTAYKQVCVIPFRRGTLRRYAELNPTPLELAESVDMLRLLEHGYPVHMVETTVPTFAVDRPEDVELVEGRLRTDPLLRSYGGSVAEAREVR